MKNIALKEKVNEFVARFDGIFIAQLGFCSKQEAIIRSKEIAREIDYSGSIIIYQKSHYQIEEKAYEFYSFSDIIKVKDVKTKQFIFSQN